MFDMKRIKPFKGLRYNTLKVRLSDVTAPPYDVINNDLRRHLYSLSPYNIVRVDASEDVPNADKYQLASAVLKSWIDEGIVIQDKNPCFYAYKIKYQINSQALSTSGIFCLCKLSDFGDGIFPHEATHSKPKEDRLNLMRACQANTSPIYAIYKSTEAVTSQIINSIDDSKFATAIDLDGHSHMIAPIDDLEAINAITTELSDKDIFIADGHHRYEVSLAYKNEVSSKSNIDDTHPCNYTMMFLANMQDEGITVLPTHRLIRKVLDLNRFFDGITKDFDIQKITSEVDDKFILNTVTKRTFVLYTANGSYILKFKGQGISSVHPTLSSLDVVILQESLLKDCINPEDISYEVSVKQCIDKVNKGTYEAVVFLSATTTSDIERVALAGQRMPPKSTYFYPKLMTGLVINKF